MMMNEIVIKKGDLFLYKSKYGGKTKGVVESAYFVNVVSPLDGGQIKEFKIKSTNGIHYSLKDIQIIDRWYTQEELDKYERVLSNIVSKFKEKEERQQDIINKYKKLKNDTEIQKTEDRSN